VVPNRWSWGYK